MLHAVGEFEQRVRQTTDIAPPCCEYRPSVLTGLRQRNGIRGALDGRGGDAEVAGGRFFNRSVAPARDSRLGERAFQFVRGPFNGRRGGQGIGWVQHQSHASARAPLLQRGNGADRQSGPLQKITPMEFVHASHLAMSWVGSRGIVTLESHGTPSQATPEYYERLHAPRNSRVAGHGVVLCFRGPTARTFIV